MTHPPKDSNTSNTSNDPDAWPEQGALRDEVEVDWDTDTDTDTEPEPEPDTTTTTTTTTTADTTTTTPETTMTVEQVTLALVASGAINQQTLTELHEASFPPDTPVAAVPVEMWHDVLTQVGPLGVGVLVRVNKYFRRLAREGGFPEGYGDYPKVVHVHTAAQLDTARTLGIRHIAVHAGGGIDPAQLGAVAATSEATLLLGPGVTATNITGGQVTAYAGATVTGISGGIVNVFLEGTATGISGGAVTVFAGGTATGISDGTVNVFAGGTATGISGGTVTAAPGGWSPASAAPLSPSARGGMVTDISGGTINVFAMSTATGIRAGTVRVWAGGTVTDIRGGTILYRDPNTGDWVPRGATG